MLGIISVSEGIFHNVCLVVPPLIAATGSGEVLVAAALGLAWGDSQHLAEGEGHFRSARVHQDSIGPGE